MLCMGENMQWKNTQDGRMAIYCLAIYVVDSMRKEAYINNGDAKISDDKKIIEYLRKLIISEWIGGK